MSTFIQTAENITPEIYLNLKQALELARSSMILANGLTAAS